MAPKTVIRLIIIHQTHYEKSDWLRAFNQFTIACELGIYHVKFNVCLVTKPLRVFCSETKWLNASLLFLRRTLQGLSNQADVELDMINAISAADIAFTSYFDLIECSQPIRFFMVSLMYNNNLCPCKANT